MAKPKIEGEITKEASKLADFIMFTQRAFLLNLSKELNKGNVSFAQFFLLGYLADEDYLTIQSIAIKMGHSTAGATGLVDRLEKLGYVQRLHAGNDRHKVMVQIARKGIDLVEKIRADIVNNLVELMRDLDPEEKSHLLESFSRLPEGNEPGTEDAPSEPESEIIERINAPAFDQTTWDDYQRLTKKLETEEISPEEQRRLIEISDAFEEASADRLRALDRLAQLRSTPVESLKAEFGLTFSPS